MKAVFAKGPFRDGGSMMKLLKDKAATGSIPNIQQVTEVVATALPPGINNYNVGDNYKVGLGATGLS